MKTLAKIAADRTLNFTDEGQVHLAWDTQNFTLTYHEFLTLARTLDARKGCEYAHEGDFTLVRVDDDAYEFWIDGACLTLTYRDYRSLRDATLSTKTRLHGVIREMPQQPDPLDGIEMRAVGPMQRPRAIKHCPN